MKVINKIVILLSILFSIFVLEEHNEEEIKYFTTKEEYFLSYENQIIEIPLFISSNECIFKSSLVSYYLNISDLTYKINKENIKYLNKTNLFNNYIYCYIISFCLNLDMNKKYEDVCLSVEYDTKSMLFEIGNITILDDDISIKELSFSKVGNNVYRYNGTLEFNNSSSLDKYYYDEQDNYTYLVFDIDSLYHYIYCLLNEEVLYIKFINYEYDLLKLKLEEVKYA